MKNVVISANPLSEEIVRDLLKEHKPYNIKIHGPATVYGEKLYSASFEYGKAELE